MRSNCEGINYVSRPLVCVSSILIAPTVSSRVQPEPSPAAAVSWHGNAAAE